MDVAEANRLPLIVLVESGGADLPRQADVFVPGGEQFRRLTQLSAAGIPTVCVVFGSSTAGGAYLPGMSDYTIFVEGRARVFLGGPPLVKMAIGEDADEEELGGAAMHARISGLCDYLAGRRARRPAPGAVMWWPTCTGAGEGPGPVAAPEPPATTRPSCSGSPRPTSGCPSTSARSSPACSTGPASRSSSPSTAPSWCCGWGTLCGLPARGRGQQRHPVLRRRPRRARSSSTLCNRIDTPILFVQNITGFMVGTRYEQERDHQRRGQADQRGLQLDRPPPHA